MDVVEGDARAALTTLEVALALDDGSHVIPESAALGAAMEDVRRRPAGAVPPHLRDAHYRSARSIGHGVGYDYPHDDPRGWAPQEHRPPETAGRVYYEPSAHGEEPAIEERMRAMRTEGGTA